MAKQYRSGGYSSKTGKRINYYDQTKKFKGMTIKQFEDATRGMKYEYAAVFDKRGKLISASTSFLPNETALPPESYGAYIVSHNHPFNPNNEPNRRIGATLSETDIKIQADLNIHEFRASAGGPNENVYIMRRKGNGNPAALKAYASRMEKTSMGKAIAKANLIRARLKAKGYSEKRIKAIGKQIDYGLYKHVWKKMPSTFGYEYVEIKRQHDW